jgi:hypothetical protein
MPPKPGLPRRRTIQFVEPSEKIQEMRKPPQPARHGAMALLDPVYFNKDAGDLTDPYQPPRVRANDGNKAISPKRY